MRQLQYKSENQRRIGEFLIEMNILSTKQVRSILLSESIPEELKKSALEQGITLTQLDDLTN
jgi:hypothetical protein